METLEKKKNTTEEIINIRYSDIDFDKKLKPSSLLNFMQDIASENAEKYGFGYSYIYPQNLMWVLLKYRIEFNEYPTNVNTLKLMTEPRGYNKLFAYRNFELFNNDSNKLFAKASTMWALVDFNTMEMVNCENTLADNPIMEKYQSNGNDLKFDKIPALTKVDYEEKFKVRYNDIDINMHANNANYIIWALEPLSYQFRKEHQLKNIDIVYKKEIKYGEKLITQVQVLENNTTVHALKNSETKENFCLLKCEWI